MWFLLYLVELFFGLYTAMLFAAVMSSFAILFYPQFASSKVFRFIGFYTNPYLNLFRKIIPPLGGIDISPLFAFLGLRIAEKLIISFLVNI